MTLQSSGAISFQQINVELQLSPTATISLNDTAVRKLLGKTSGIISMQDAYGKAHEIRFINTEARTSVSIYELMGSPTEPTNYIFENNAVINANTLTYALRTGVFPTGSTLTIINNNYIYGKGGEGSGTADIPGGAGGDAIYLDMPCRIDNTNGYILAGGGGGGSARRKSPSDDYFIGAGGGGGAGSVVSSGGWNSYQVYGTDTITSTLAKGQSPTTGGTGGTVNAKVNTYNETAYGGAGGANGASGTVGSTISQGTSTYKTSITLGVAGAAGHAIIANGKTLTQIAGFDSTHVKGAIV